MFNLLEAQLNCTLAAIINIITIISKSIIGLIVAIFDIFIKLTKMLRTRKWRVTPRWLRTPRLWTTLAGRAGRDQGVGPKKQKILKLLIGNEPLSHFTLTYSFHEFEILCVLCFHFHNIWNSIGWVKCQFWKKNRTKLNQLSGKIFDTKQALTTCGAFSQRSRPRIIFHSTYDNFFVTFTTKVPYWPFCAKMIQFLI